MKRKKEVGFPTSFFFTNYAWLITPRTSLNEPVRRADAGIHHECDVAFSNASLTDRTIGDEREAMGILEAALSDDVALESRSTQSRRGHRRCSGRMQCAAGSNVSVGRLGRRSRTAGGCAVVVNGASTSLDTASSLPLNGSREVLLIAMPVSKPAWFVTNGKSKFVTHWSIRKALAGRALSMKRGIGSDGAGRIRVRVRRIERSEATGYAGLTEARQVVRGVRRERYAPCRRTTCRCWPNWQP